jgi:hypothetical protein
MPRVYDVGMSNPFPCEVIPHARFVEYQDRRRKKAARPVEPDSSRTIDIHVEGAPVRIPELVFADRID